MKKVLSAGVILLAGACLLSARAQEDPPPPQAGSEVVKETKPKNSRKTGAQAKGKPSSARATSKKSAPAAQNTSRTDATGAKDADSYYQIGMSHYESKRFKDAIEAFKQSIRLGSTEPKTYFNLGQAYYSLNQYKEARESFKRAVKGNPNWAEAHYQLGWMYHILGDENSALAQYKILQVLSSETAAKFQKLLDDDRKTAAASKINATSSSPANNSATSSKDNAQATVPGDRDSSKTDSGKTQEPAPPAPDNTNKQALTPETNSSLNGNSASTGTDANSNSASANPTDANANSTGTPAKVDVLVSAPTSTSSELPLTSVYRVGVGDVLDIRLLNAPISRSTLFTVMSGGLIEYALVGGSFPVAGLTTDEISARLTAELKRRGIGGDSQVVVSVRDYTSHAVVVSGLVNYPGTKILRREAVPLYVIVAEAQLRPDASRAIIMRTGETIPINDINDPLALNVLIKPGDVITISARVLQYYFIGGRINSPGQKIYQSGLTLTQAILAAGGLSRSQDSAEISREETDGRLTTKKYVLKDIKSGKIPDPRLQPGDRIELGH